MDESLDNMGKLIKKTIPYLPAEKRNLALMTAAILISVSLLVVTARLYLSREKLFPSVESDVWVLEMKISSSGMSPGKISVPVPSDDYGQTILEEKVLSMGHPCRFAGDDSNRRLEFNVKKSEPVKIFYRSVLRLSGRKIIANSGDGGLIEDQDENSSRELSIIPAEGTGIRKPGIIMEVDSGNGNAAIVMEPEEKEDTREMIVISRGRRADASSAIQGDARVSYRILKDLYSGQEEVPEWEQGLTATLSLRRLPVETQKLVKILLTLPLAALLVVVFRTILNIETVGTFLPVILAISFKSTELLPGLAMLTIVLLIGIAALSLFKRIGLPKIPASALMVAVVVITLSYLSLAGELLEIYRLENIAFFPIIIMTLLVERLTSRFVDRGAGAVLRIYAGTVATASASYFIVTSGFIQGLFLRFPELLLAVMGLIITVSVIDATISDSSPPRPRRDAQAVSDKGHP